MTNKIFIEKVLDGRITNDIMRKALNWIGLSDAVKRNSKIFIKPNFTFPSFKRGVTTSPEYIEMLVRVLKENTDDITIGESDGGYNSWKAEAAFKGHNLEYISKKYNVKLVNLCKTEKTSIQVVKQNITYNVPFPRFLKEETNIFITMPVPKVHCMTGVSLSMKNQWGLIPDTMRMKYHHIFNEAILELNKVFSNYFVVADGTYILNTTGPMFGDPLKKDMIIASNNFGSFEAALCEIMSINIHDIPHLKFAQTKGFIPKKIEDIEFNKKVLEFKYQSNLVISNRSKITRKVFKSKCLTYVLYTSLFGRFIHEIYYLFSKNRKDINKSSEGESCENTTY